MITRQAVQHTGEIRLRVETVQLCGLDDRIQDCRAVTAAIGTEEQKILARDSYSSQQPPARLLSMLSRPSSI
jgi:hypothetical protein